MQADDETPQPGSEIGTLPANEGKSNKILEIRVDPSNEIDGGIRTALVDVSKNSQEVGPRLVRKDDPHSDNYLIFGGRAWRRNSSKLHSETRPAATSSNPSVTCPLRTRNFSACSSKYATAVSRMSSGRSSTASAAFSAVVLMALYTIYELARQFPCFVTCHLLPRHLPGHQLLPILSVKRERLDRGDIEIIETADIDVDLVGIGARHIEGMDAADRAEGVLRRAGVELISGQCVRAA